MAGLSLIELMISITLGLMILSGVAFVFVNTSQARNEIERTSRQIENGRYAVEVIADDLSVAGFYGELNVAAAAAPTLLPTDQCSLDETLWPNWVQLHVQGFDNGTGFNQSTCALTNHKANTDILVIRRARTCVAGTTGCGAVINGRAYVQASLCNTEATSFKLGTQGGSTTFDLKQLDCTNAAVKREYYVHIYYVSTDNGSGQNVPTLKRMELDGGAWTTTSLVEGIEQFNVEYGVDTNGDGAPDSYVAAPAALADWLNVVSAQIFVLARNLEASPGYIDSKTYTLGSATPITVTTGDSYRRHIYSSLTRINNAAGRRDTP